MLIQEGYEYKEQLKKLLQTWSIVAFETGKIDGSGYGYKVHDSYGSECGEMFIVSVAPIWSWSVRSLFVYFSQRKTMIDGVRSYLSFFKSHVFK